jgi:hypothetical protein
MLHRRSLGQPIQDLAVFFHVPLDPSHELFVLTPLINEPSYIGLLSLDRSPTFRVGEDFSLYVYEFPGHALSVARGSVAQR